MSEDKRLDDLEAKHDVLERQIKRLENLGRLEVFRQESVFSASLKSSQKLSKGKVTALDHCVKVHTGSKHFDARKDQCKFTAPTTGSYFFDLELRQNHKCGKLEGIINHGPKGDMKSIHLCRTQDSKHAFNKSVVLRLSEGEDVSVAVKQVSGKAQLECSAFMGYLISGSDDLIREASAKRPTMR